MISSWRRRPYIAILGLLLVAMPATANSQDSEYLANKEITYSSNQELLQALLDRHGTGRVYFRNTRKVMENVYTKGELSAVNFPFRKVRCNFVVNYL